MSTMNTQLARWVGDGKVVKLRRGVYLLGRPWRKINPHPFLIANYLTAASYVSLQSILSHYELIPEYVANTTSVTTSRPGRISTQEGHFINRHIKRELFWGYERVEIQPGQNAFMATPEKALLDLIYLTDGGDDENYLNELRLQNLEALNTDVLFEMADRSGSSKLQRAVKHIADLARMEAEEFLTL